MTQEDKILSSLGLAHDRLLSLEKRFSTLIIEVDELSSDMDEVLPLRTRHPATDGVAGSPEYYKELAAAVAESEGHVVLTDELKDKIEKEAILHYLAQMDLQTAINHVRHRLPSGINFIQVIK